LENKNIDKSMERAKTGGTFKFLKTKYLGLEKDTYKYELTFSDECLNPFKTVQGGMIASALDEITSISVNIFTKDKMLPNSTDIHVTFHRPVLPGKVIGTAKIIKLGKTIVSVEGKLYSVEGKLAASALHTAILTDTSIIK
jgi:acyl-CoA thioesterase|tara:strand:- start:6927 stop:7349 length:423 start_codon:yes stop_codon:yes gene_type:complete